MRLKSPYTYFGGKSKIAADTWKASGGYRSYDKGNRERERLYRSPHCLKPPTQMSLFDHPESRISEW